MVAETELLLQRFSTLARQVELMHIGFSAVSLNPMI